MIFIEPPQIESCYYTSLVAFQFLGTPDEMSGWLTNHVARDARPFMRLEMPCGNALEYQTPDDVPRATVACPCGDPTHWMIRIAEAR